MKDRLWYFGGMRDEGSERGVPGMFANLNDGDPTKWTYVADTSRPAVYAASFRMLSLRLTVQATPRNKFNVFWDEQMPCEGGAVPGAGNDVDACRRSGDGEYFAGGTAAPTPRASATAAPETAAYRAFGNRVRQVKWTSPVTNRLLLESNGGAYWSRYGGKPMPGAKTADMIRVVEQCAVTCVNNGDIPGLDVPLPQLVFEHQHVGQLERGCHLRARRSEPEGRIPGSPPVRRAADPRIISTCSTASKTAFLTR